MNDTRSVRRWPLLLLVLIVALAFPACAGGPDPTFVAAARDTLAAVGPEYLAYVDADPVLTPEQRARRHATIDRFAEAIAVREAAAREVRR